MSGCSWGWWEGDTLVCRLRLTPRSARDALLLEGGRLRLRVSSPALEGRANCHAAGYLARLFGVPPRQVRLLRGEKSRDKLFAIERPRRTPATLAADLPRRSGPPSGA